jgi:hypothetical protein
MLKLTKFRSAVITATCVLAMTAGAAATVPSATAATPTRVGWWAGQKITPTCTSPEPTSCPRDNSKYTDDFWAALKDTNSFLNFNLVYGSDFGPPLPGVTRRTDGLDVIKKANEKGVEVNAWITLPLQMGTFSNEKNAQFAQDAVKAFKAFKDEKAVNINETIVDLEFPTGYQWLADTLKTGDVTKITNELRVNLDPRQQCTAIRKYRETTAWAKSNGLNFAGSPLTFAFDDLKDGNLAMQDGFNMVAFPPTDYNAYYVQAYRAIGPLDIGSGTVAAYYNEMQQMFPGAKGQVSIGNIGSAPYDKVDGVVQDVRLLSALGAARVPIFDGDAALASFGPGGIRTIGDAPKNPMSAAEVTAASKMTALGTATRDLFKAIDAIDTALTVTITTLRLDPQLPNSVDGCK